MEISPGAQPNATIPLRRPLSNLYPATVRWIYLDVQSMGLLPETAREHALDSLDAQLMADPEAQGSSEESCRRQFAALVGSTVRNVALSRSFAHALVQVARQLRPRRGGNLVMCSALSSPSFSAFWRGYAARNNLALREAGLEHGGPPGSGVAGLIDAKTCVVALPALSHARALRLPLAEIGAACRARGVFFAVDATSCAGVLRLQMEASGIDALVVAAEKNALGLRGTGFTCIARSGADRTADARWQSLWPAAGPAQWLRAHESGEDDASGSNVAESDPVMLAVANTAMGALLDCGLEHIESHAMCLAEQLRKSLEELGLAVDRPLQAAQRSHVVVVGPAGSALDGELPDSAMQALAAELTAGRVRFGVCAGQLQFGFHLYNGVRDVMDVRRIAAQFLQG